MACSAALTELRDFYAATVADVKANVTKSLSSSRRAFASELASVRMEERACRPPQQATFVNSDGVVVSVSDELEALQAKNDSLGRFIAQLSSTIHHVCSALSVGAYPLAFLDRRPVMCCVILLAELALPVPCLRGSCRWCWCLWSCAFVVAEQMPCHCSRDGTSDSCCPTRKRQ